MKIDLPLLPHQRYAVEYLRRLKVGALYMEPDAGKVRTALELARIRMERGKIDGVLWLCACSCRENIRREIAQLTGGDLSFVHIVGLESLSHSWRLLISLERLTQKQRLMLVVDGGELIKSSHALRTIRTLSFSARCPYRLLINEVPLIRSVEDMFAQWYLLDWRILGYQSFWSFSQNHLEIDRNAPGKRHIKNLEYLLKRIRPYACQVQRGAFLPVAQRQEYIWQFRLPPDVMNYYHGVIRKFLHIGCDASSQVYRLLSACQQMVSGRSLLAMRPLRTHSLYARPEDNPRIQALMSVLKHFPRQRILILCRFRYEVEDVLTALRRAHPCEQPGEAGQQSAARILVMNHLCSDCRRSFEEARVVIHYAHDWDWGSRRRAESALPRSALTIVNLVAADTIDVQILACLRHKQNLADMIRQGLASLLPTEEEPHAQAIY